MSEDKNSESITKSVWIEPQVLSLDVSQTAAYPNRGTDGNIHLDCTKS